MKVLSIEKDAKEILEWYHKFHDGFIKSLKIYSHDYFEPDKSQVCLGTIDVEIDFAHHNYNQGKPPHNQIIHAYFGDVKSFNFAFPEIECGDWSIFNTEFIKRTENFVAKFVFGFYDKKCSLWTQVEGLSFVFKEAEFTE